MRRTVWSIVTFAAFNGVFWLMFVPSAVLLGAPMKDATLVLAVFSVPGGLGAALAVYHDGVLAGRPEEKA